MESTISLEAIADNRIFVRLLRRQACAILAKLDEIESSTLDPSILETQARCIRETGEISRDGQKRLKDNLEWLDTTTETARRKQNSLNFLKSVKDEFGNPWLVLLAQSFSKRQIMKLNHRDEEDLLLYIRENKEMPPQRIAAYASYTAIGRDHEVIGSVPTGPPIFAGELDKLKVHSQDAYVLMHIICFLQQDGIHEHMFHLLRTPRFRWSESGTCQGSTARETSDLDPLILDFFMDESRLRDAIEKLIVLDWVKTEPGICKLPRLLPDPQLQIYLLQRVRNPDYWRLQAIRLVCCVFPRDQHFEPLYGNIGRSQLPQVQHISTFTFALQPEDDKRFAATLLSASHFSDQGWKSYILTQASTYVGSAESWLHILLQQRWAGILSKQTLEETIMYPAQDNRTNAAQGSMILLYAEKQVQQSAFREAWHRAEQWKPLDINSVSEMEQIVLNNKCVLKGRILRLQGFPKDALAAFRDISLEVSPYTELGCTVLSERAAAECEIGHDLQRVAQALEENLEYLSSLNQRDLLKGRKVQLALADVYLSLGRRQQSFTIFKNVSQVFLNNKNPSRKDRVGYVRSCMGMARAKHLDKYWEAAIRQWKVALESLHKCQWIQGHSEMIVQYGLAHAHSELARSVQAHYHQQEGDRILERLRHRKEVQNRWFPGVGTHFQGFIFRALGIADQ